MLEPVRELLRRPAGESLGPDPIWGSHLAREIWQASTELEAVLEERTVSLSDMADLRMGSVLRLQAGVDSPVTLRCGRVRIAAGRVGRSGDRLAVGVEDVVTREGNEHDRAAP
jgi:flagellar motor switch protein FliM